MVTKLYNPISQSRCSNRSPKMISLLLVLPLVGSLLLADVDLESHLLLVDQNRRLFSKVDITVEYTLEIPETVSDWANAKAESVDESAKELESAALPPGFVDQLKGVAKASGRTFDEVKSDWVKSAIERRKEYFQQIAAEAGRSMSTTQRYLSTPEIIEIHMHLAEDDPRRIKAIEDGLEHPNGGHFVRVQRQAGRDSLWYGIEPYADAKAQVSCWKGKNFSGVSVAPLFIDSTYMEGSRSLGMSELVDLAADTSRMKGANSISLLEDGVVVSIPVDENGFWLSRLDGTGSGVPAWNARVALGAKKPIDESMIERLVKEVEAFRTSRSQQVDAHAHVIEVVYFDDVRKVDGGGHYPFKLQRIQIETSRAIAPADGLTGHLTKVETIAVQAISVGSQVKGPKPIKILPNMSVVDLDARESDPSVIE